MSGRRSLLPTLTLCLFALVAPLGAPAQTIGLRTVPVATGDQFLVHASRTLGMGSVSIAIDDPWLDPFLNPALGSRLEESAFLAAPTFYGIEGGNGAGRTVPLTGLFAGSAWFGGTSVALQQIIDENGGPEWVFLPGTWIDPAWPRRLDASDATNTYASFFLGRRLGRGWSFGTGASIAKLNAVDGVDLLYAGS